MDQYGINIWSLRIATFKRENVLNPVYDAFFTNQSAPLC